MHPQADPEQTAKLPLLERNPKLWAKHRKRKETVLLACGGIAFMGLSIVLAQQCFTALAYGNHLSSGLKALEAGKYDLAQVEFSLSITADPRSSDAYYNRSLAELKRGSITAAVADCQKAIELNDANIDARLLQALLDIDNHDYRQAIADCDAILKRSPECAEAYRLRAIANNHLGLFFPAIADSTTYLRMHQTADTARADALSKRAFAYDRKHDYKDAAADYTQALNIDPRNPALLASRAVVLAQMQRWKEALADCNSAYRMNTSDPVVFKVRGLCYAHLNSPQAALKDFDRLVALHPTADMHRLRGKARMSAHDYLGSVKDFERVLQVDPDDRTASLTYIQAKAALQMQANAQAQGTQVALRKDRKACY